MLLSPASAGGTAGSTLTLALVRAINDLEHHLASSDFQLRALILGYSLGNRTDGVWDLVERSGRILGSERIRWRLLHNEPLWRVNGKKEQPNPMPLESLALKADSVLDLPDVTQIGREGIRAQYQQLADTFATAGWDHLGYGVLEVDVPSSAHPGPN